MSALKKYAEAEQLYSVLMNKCSIILECLGTLPLITIHHYLSFFAFCGFKQIRFGPVNDLIKN